MLAWWAKKSFLAFFVAVVLRTADSFSRATGLPRHGFSGKADQAARISVVDGRHLHRFARRRHNERHLRIELFSQGAREPSAVDVDSPDLKERRCKIKIKPAKFHNLRAVSRLLVAEFYGATLWFPAQCLTELNRLQTNFHEYGEDASRHLMLLATAVDDGSLVGFVDIDGREKKPGETGVRPYLSDLAVANRFQRMGIGTQLVKACEEACIGWGYDHMYLKVRVGNKAARKLYENLGYEVYSPTAALSSSSSSHNNEGDTGSGFIVETGNKQAEIMLCGDLRARSHVDAGAVAAEEEHV